MSWTSLMPLAAKVDMKDVGEAMYFVLVVIIAFIILMFWAKRKNKKRTRK